MLQRAFHARGRSVRSHRSSLSLSLRAASRSSFSPSSDSSSPLLSVRNTATSYGHVNVLLPLPGVKGLTRVAIDDATATVTDLIAAVKAADATLKTVEVATLESTKFARTVRLSELLSMPFCVRLNHVNVLIESPNAAIEEHKAREESVAFATLKAEIAHDSRLIMPVSEFYHMCTHAGAEERVATKWLRELQRRNLLVHFDRSRTFALENALILRPYSLESLLTLQNALDSKMYNLKHTRHVHERQLTDLTRAVKKCRQLERDVALAARRLPNVQKWVGLSSLTGFYGTLMYCVWDVYSWDVMEPITYFLGFTAVLGNSFYHSLTKQEPTYSNMWQKWYADRVARLSKDRNYDPAERPKLEARIADLKNDVTRLSQWEGDVPA